MTTASAFRVALYARVSTSRQAEADLSIPDQVHQAELWCEQRGFTLGPVPIAATTRHLIQAVQEGLDHGGVVLAERGAMGGY